MDLNSILFNLKKIISQITLKDGNYMFKNYNMKFTCDGKTVESNKAGYDIAGDPDGVLEEFHRVIGLDRLKAVHFNDSMNPRGSRKDRHQKLGQGEIGMEAMRRIALHPALQGLPFILETPNDDAGYAAEIQTMRSWFA